VDSGEFVRRAKPFRRELLAHCYRMLASVADAEDAVQESYLRAWRGYDGFEHRSSFRSWLYKIATNCCLTLLEHRDRRMLPSGLDLPSDDPLAPALAAGADVSWVQPIPDAMVAPAGADPAAVLAAREGLRLALIASLQYLLPKQRAVLILREVLRFSADEVADMLDTTTAAVKSTLQRARAQIEQAAPSADDIRDPTGPEARALLGRYIAAFESADAGAIERLLREDATLEMVGSRTWFAGKRTCNAYISAQALGGPGDWRMVPTMANGQPAAIAYLRDHQGQHQPFGVAVLTVTPQGIARIVVFPGAGVVTIFAPPPGAPISLTLV